MKSLAVKYRPKTFDEIYGQEVVKKILSRQLELKTFKNSYLFCGPSGCGKTTMARAFANAINDGKGIPIEIDAASNNGVENIRNITANANTRSIDSEYKIFILDECHSLTSQSWQALLKTIEETPKFTIFIMCTTDPEKIPDTIINRCMRFNFGRISSDLIYNRLKFICEKEGFINYDDTCSYISKSCNGQMRDGISMLDKISDYSIDLSLDMSLKALGTVSFDTFFNLLNALVDSNQGEVIKCIDEYYLNGFESKLFIDKFISFLLDVEKFIMFKSFDIIAIPKSLEDKLIYSISFQNNLDYINHYLDEMIELKKLIIGDSDEKTTISIILLNMSKWKKGE